MKKIIAILLSVLFVFGSVSIFAFAAPIKKDAGEINYLNWLDFSKETTDPWAVYDEETGEWSCGIYYGTMNQPEDPDTHEVSGTYIHNYSAYKNNTMWSLIEDGEVFHFEVTGENKYPGLGFVIDEYHESVFGVGKESDKKAEFIKIRVRNYSSANRFTFGFAVNSSNNWSFVGATVTDLMTDKDGKTYKSGTGEWETYIFSMPTVNVETNYQEMLATDKDGNLVTRWGGSLGELLIFPFGYNIEDGSGAYPGASIDIDYIVIGSEEYVTNYKSALELKEESITKLEFVTKPSKTVYHVGDNLDLSGLQLKATYKDGTTEILSSASSSYNLATGANSTPVTLKFGPYSVSYDVQVVGLTGIEVSGKPDSTTYELESLENGFTPEGFTYTAHYTDGTTRELSATQVRYASPSNFGAAGHETVTANYYGFTTTFDIDIINVVDFGIPTPETLFRYNSSLTETNVPVYLIYSDGSKKLSTADDCETSVTFTYTYNLAAPGLVTCSVLGTNEDMGINITKEFTVNVEAPVEMKVTKNPTKTTYNVGEEFDSTGMTVSLVYADGKAVPMNAADYNVRVDLSSPGNKTATISSRVEGLDLRTTLDITVEGTPITPNNTTNASTTNGGSNDGAPIGVIVGIVVAVLVVVAVVVVVVVVLKKKKK